MELARIVAADSPGCPLLYKPIVLAPGSCVSHWNASATPNLPLETNIKFDPGLILVAPTDLTVQLLKDIAWQFCPTQH